MTKYIFDKDTPQEVLDNYELLYSEHDGDVLVFEYSSKNQYFMFRFASALSISKVRKQLKLPNADEFTIMQGFTTGLLIYPSDNGEQYKQLCVRRPFAPITIGNSLQEAALGGVNEVKKEQ